MKKIISLSILITVFSVNLSLDGFSEENRENKRLKISIALNKSEFKIGDELILNLNFENISNNSFCFYFCTVYTQGLQFINEKGEICDKLTTTIYKLAPYEHYIYKLSPRKKKTFSFKAVVRFSFFDNKDKSRIGKPVIDFNDINHIILTPGKFKAVVNYKAEKSVFDLSKSIHFLENSLNNPLSIKKLTCLLPIIHLYKCRKLYI